MIDLINGLGIPKIEDRNELSTRLLVIETFIENPPESEFQRGYLCALMDEAVTDMDEAKSPIVERMINAIEMSEENTDMRTRHWRVTRTQTLSV